MKPTKLFLCSVVFALFSLIAIAPGWAQSTPAGRVSGIDPDHSYVLRLVSSVLRDRHIVLWSVEAATNDPISSYEEFRAHLLPYRARYRFHVDGNTLIVTMEDLQSPGKGGTWTRSVIPADGAQAKLIAQVVDQLNAASRRMASGEANQGSGSATATASGLSGATVSDRLDGSTPPLPNAAGSMVFDLPEETLAKGAYHCAEGLCAISKNGLWGFVDYHGNLVLDFKYPNTGSAPYFSHGVCAVGAPDSKPGRPASYIFIDKKGNVLFNQREFKFARPFVGTATTVLLPQKTGLDEPAILDIQGHIVRYAPRDPVGQEFHGDLIASGATYVDGAVGFRNAKMEWVIPRAYYAAQDFSEGMAWVQARAPGGLYKWGAINGKGKLIIPLTFSQSPEPFSEGLSVIHCSDNTSGYVDPSGTLVIPCQYASASRFVHGHAFVRDSSSHWFLIDQHGIVVNNVRMRNVPAGTLREDGLYAFTQASGTVFGLLDADANLVVPAQFESIGLFPTDGDPDGLAWAVYRDENRKAHQGFINRRGEFVLMVQKSLL
jgi:hypothetical protein